MALKLSDDDIWFWYSAIIEQQEGELSAPTYCKERFLDYKKFTNMRYRMFYIEHMRPDEYKVLMKAGREFIDSPLQLSEFAKANKVDKTKLTEARTHILYKEAIERLKKERGGKEAETMNFVQLKNPAKPQMAFLSPPPQEHEVVEAQNDIELVITKGVKVMISPQVDSMKIIKIIELLKDL